MGKKKTLLFVYGSLRKGERYDHFLAGAEPVAMQAWSRGLLFDTGDGYPGMVLLSPARVYREVYRLTEKELAAVDDLEDYRPGGSDNLYERIRLTVGTDRGNLDVHSYVYARPREEGMAEVEGGDWRSRRLLKGEEFLYFAYGSCMDDERFRLQGVEREFREITGCGVLKGYGMRYTLPYADGGRADIVEDGKSTVEGKVYRIGRKGLEYLVWREGVNRGAYRPAWVPLGIGKRTVPDVLTFTVVDKQKESAPPEHYAREILRGSRGTVSDAYHRRLQRDLEWKFGMKVRF